MIKVDEKKHIFSLAAFLVSIAVIKMQWPKTTYGGKESLFCISEGNFKKKSSQ